jgi:hypothetical protein
MPRRDQPPGGTVASLECHVSLSPAVVSEGKALVERGTYSTPVTYRARPSCDFPRVSLLALHPFLNSRVGPTPLPHVLSAQRVQHLIMTHRCLEASRDLESTRA